MLHLQPLRSSLAVLSLATLGLHATACAVAPGAPPPSAEAPTDEGANDGVEPEETAKAPSKTDAKGTAAPAPAPSEASPAAPEATPPAPGGWERTSKTVGLASLGKTCASLPLYKGPDVVAAGTKLSGVRITKPINIAASGIVIEGSCITGGVTNYGTGRDGVTIRDSEIAGETVAGTSTLGLQGGYNLINTWIHGFAVGLWLMTTGRDTKLTIEGNVIEATGIAFEVQYFVTGAAVLRNNRLVATGAKGKAVYVYSSGGVEKIAFERNLLVAPYQWTYLHGSATTVRDLTFVDNRFTGSGVSVVDSSARWAEWEENAMLDPKGVDMAGAVLATP